MGKVSIQSFFDTLRPCQESQILARFIHVEAGEKILDAGCGTGYLSLYIGWNFPQCGGVVGIDIVPNLIVQANKNLSILQSLQDIPLPPIRFAVEDARLTTETDELFDLLISNPPFFAFHSSRPARIDERRIARQDCELTIPELFDCAQQRLRTGGRFYLVIPAPRLDEIRECAKRLRFELAAIETDRSIRKRSGGVCLVHMVR